MFAAEGSGVGRDRKRDVQNAHICLYVWAFRLVQQSVNRRRLRHGRGDDAACDAVAGVAGGVCLFVVLLLVDDNGGSAVGGDAVRRGGVERDVSEVEAGLPDVAFADHDVLGEIAGVVAHGVLVAVLLAGGVVVAASGLEVGRVTVGAGVDVNAVLTCGKVFEVELEVDALFAGAEGGSACIFAGAGLDGDDDGASAFASAGIAKRVRVQAARILRIRVILLNRPT